MAEKVSLSACIMIAENPFRSVALYLETPVAVDKRAVGRTGFFLKRSHGRPPTIPVQCNRRPDSVFFPSKTAMASWIRRQTALERTVPVWANSSERTDAFDTVLTSGEAHQEARYRWVGAGPRNGLEMRQEFLVELFPGEDQQPLVFGAFAHIGQDGISVPLTR